VCKKFDWKVCREAAQDAKSIPLYNKQNAVTETVKEQDTDSK